MLLHFSRLSCFVLLRLCIWVLESCCAYSPGFFLDCGHVDTPHIVVDPRATVHVLITMILITEQIPDCTFVTVNQTTKPCCKWHSHQKNDQNVLNEHFKSPDNNPVKSSMLFQKLRYATGRFEIGQFIVTAQTVKPRNTFNATVPPSSYPATVNACNKYL